MALTMMQMPMSTRPRASASGKSPADTLLDEFETEWNGKIDEIFRRHAY